MLYENKERHIEHRVYIYIYVCMYICIYLFLNIRHIEICINYVYNMYNKV